MTKQQKYILSKSLILKKAKNKLKVYGIGWGQVSQFKLTSTLAGMGPIDLHGPTRRAHS